MPGPFDEPEYRTPVRRGLFRSRSCHRAEQDFGVPFVGFIAPMRGEKRKRVLHEPTRHRLATSLGKAALKTHALQTLRDCRVPPNRAKRLECVRFIGAFGPAPDGQRFKVLVRRALHSSLSMLMRGSLGRL